ncbi:MAG: class I SAM-dependent methyltransferase [Bacteroidota bacterium]
MTVQTGVAADLLYRELNQRFRLQKVPVELGAYSLELIKVADLDELLEGVSDADQIPFWAELWPASLGLVRYIFNNPELLEESSGLELGAGIGLAGIAARLAGAKLIQTDYMEDALRFIRVNSLRNGLSEPQLLLADWRRFPQVGKFDFILGADILYEKTLHQDLAKILAETIKPNGIVLLADPGRDYALEFVLGLMDQGWRVRQSRVPVIYENNTHQIDIYQLRLGGTANK